MHVRGGQKPRVVRVAKRSEQSRDRSLAQTRGVEGLAVDVVAEDQAPGLLEPGQTCVAGEDGRHEPGLIGHGTDAAADQQGRRDKCHQLSLHYGCF
jgi:hypothetical protein